MTKTFLALTLAICGIYPMEKPFEQTAMHPEVTIKDVKNSIEIIYRPNDHEIDFIHQGLREFNGHFFGHSKEEIYFAVLLKDEREMTVGGIIALVLPGIHMLCIDTIWIIESMRGQGYGTELMLAAEEEGKKLGCTHSQLETLPFQAESFYQKLGYTRFGLIENMYGSYDAIYLRKNLVR